MCGLPAGYWQNSGLGEQNTAYVVEAKPERTAGHDGQLHVSRILFREEPGMATNGTVRIELMARRDAGVNPVLPTKTRNNLLTSAGHGTIGDIQMSCLALVQTALDFD